MNKNTTPADNKIVSAEAADQRDPGSIFFQAFKYLIYVLLARNIWLFFQEESAAALLMETDGIAIWEYINVYAATIDTFFWVVLLLLFELETWVIPDEQLTPKLKTLLTVLRAVCYASIVYAVWGYTGTYLELAHDWKPITTTLCDQVGNAFMFSLERFEPITAANCETLASSPEILVSAESLFVDASRFNIAWLMAIADVVNAVTWLLVVVILEVEVRMQLSGRLQQGIGRGIIALKAVLYSTLVVVAIFWGIFGEFIDFWDALLWIVAFVFIESNMIQWNKETRERPGTAVR